MTQILAQVWRGVGYAGAVVVPTWLFFGPIAGFHHMIHCGLLCPVFLDGETRMGGPIVLGEYALVFSPGRFAISLVLWAICVFYWVRFVRSPKYVG